MYRSLFNEWGMDVPLDGNIETANRKFGILRLMSFFMYPRLEM